MIIVVWRLIMTTSEQIRVLCVRSGVSLSELARRINQTPQNFSVKLKRNTVTQDELNQIAMWSIYTGKNVCEQLPTEELWDKLQTILEFNIPYAKISQTYHAQIGLTDVWDDVNFYEEKDRIHPTQKPQKLLARLILASSDEDDIVLDPFMGGGSTALACINNKRNYIGFEIEQEYYEKSLERLACRQMTLL